MNNDRRAAAVASLRGLAVGDAIGSCFLVPSNLEALAARQLPSDPWYWTDDAEMACSVFAVLDRRGRIDQDALAASFAAHHDFDRGYGPGINRMLRLIRQEGADWRELVAQAWDGRGSWGNGAAMRVAPLGAYYGARHGAESGGTDGPDSPDDSLDLEHVVAEATASATVTHTHPEGVAGAVAVAVAAALVTARDEVEGGELLRLVAEWTPAGLVRDGIENAISLLTLDDPRTVSAILGNGREVSAQDTVPFCLWVAAKHSRDYADAFWTTARVGGDIDTNCAIVGGIVAARTGIDGIPGEWLARCERLPDWAQVGELGLA